MSSHPSNNPPSSSQFLPPQSAQARGSLFGGPSSDADLPPSSLPERPRRSLFGGFSSEDVPQEPAGQRNAIGQPELEQEEDDFDLILRERPLEAYYGSSESDYEDSGDEGRKSSKRTAKSKPAPAEPAPSEAVSQKPIYVVHRGVDLPPGTARPNRWDGAPSDYRHAIRPERGAYESLMTTRARDLAAHLYDSFWARQTKTDQDQDDDEENDDDKAKRASRKWMAWPMPADCVPRNDEPVRRRLDGFDTYRMQPDMRPSADLEEWIIATMTKTAKERFLAREWEDEEIQPSREQSVNAMKVDDDDAKYDSEKIKSPTPQTPAGPPMVQTDEDILHHQLRPLSRAVIAQLDRLLMGLHSSFRHRTNDLDSSDDSATDTDEETSRSRSRSNKKKQPQHRGLKRSREDDSEQVPGDRTANLRSSPYGEEFEGDDVFDLTQSAGISSQTRGKLRDRLLLRDWSEVMGLAAMMGLPSGAVQRASRRCAQLFNQDMIFQKFNEGRIKQIGQRADGALTFGYFEGESDSNSRESKRRTISRSNSKASARSQSRSRPRVEMTPPVVAVKPAPPPVRASSVVSNTNAAQSQSGKQKQPGFGKGAHRKMDLLCPYPHCKRSTNGISRTWNLNHHIKRAHGGIHPPVASGKSGPSKSPAPSTTQPSTSAHVIDLD